MSKLYNQDSQKSMKAHGSYFAKSQIVRRLDSSSPSKKHPRRAEKVIVIKEEKTVQKLNLDGQSSKFMTYLKKIGIVHHAQHQQDFLRVMTQSKNNQTDAKKFFVNCMI